MTALYTYHSIWLELFTEVPSVQWFPSIFFSQDHLKSSFHYLQLLFLHPFQPYLIYFWETDGQISWPAMTPNVLLFTTHWWKLATAKWSMNSELRIFVFEFFCVLSVLRCTGCGSAILLAVNVWKSVIICTSVCEN